MAQRRSSNTTRPIINKTDPVDAEPDEDLWMSRIFKDVPASANTAQALARAAVKLEREGGIGDRDAVEVYEQIAAELRTQTIAEDLQFSPPVAPPVECVYFIRCGKWVKIGTTISGARKRFASMQLPPNAELVGVMHGLGREHEATLHQMFASWRVAGEWFEETADLTALIAANPI